MTTMREVLEAAPDWTTLREIEARVGSGPGRKAHDKIRSLCRNYVRTGRMESRWSEERGTEYRARERPRASLASAPLERRALRLMGDGPVTTRQMADMSGQTVRQAWDTMDRLRRRRLVERVRDRPRILWMRAEGSDRVPGGNALQGDAGGDGMRDDEEDRSEEKPRPSKEAEELERDRRNEP